MLFFNKILSVHKGKSHALREYLKKIVIYQSTNKSNLNWNEKRRSTINMTYRQIKENTGLSLATISKVINKMLKNGEIKLACEKKSKYKNPMRFYYFVNILNSITKKKAFKIVKTIMDYSKKVNTRNIYYINKLIYKNVLKELNERQLDLVSTHWNFIKRTWETVQQPNFKYTDQQRISLFSEMKSFLA